MVAPIEVERYTNANMVVKNFFMQILHKCNTFYQMPIISCQASWIPISGDATMFVGVISDRLSLRCHFVYA